MKEVMNKEMDFVMKRGKKLDRGFAAYDQNVGDVCF
jgi:hypothetical protein